MSKPQVHQFHSGTAFGDAITNGMFYVQKLLRKIGFQSEIYAEHIAPDLEGRIKHFSRYESDPGNAIIVHHSMGHDQIGWIEKLEDKKLLIYHNVTPVSFFEEGSFLRRYALKGREMLHELKPLMSAAAGDSEENAGELTACGYLEPLVLPALLDRQKIADGAWNERLVQEESRHHVILFVGRIARNKCQHDLVTMAAALRRYTRRDFKLVLVGGYDRNDSYYQSLAKQIEDQNLQEIVRLTGKVSDEDLRAWYRAASVYVSMSEHEGFGVPFIESMAFDLPIVAYSCHAIPGVLGEAGLLFEKKDMEWVPALVAEVLENRSLRRNILRAQRRRLSAFSEPEILRQLKKFLESAGIPTRDSLSHGNGVQPAAYTPPKWQFEGPFETSYSLAVVNRNLALAMHELERGHVALWPTEGAGDYTPKAEDLNRHPQTIELYKRARKGSQADVVVRNLWPPRLSDADGLINLSAFAWEESVIPTEIINEINSSVDGVLVPSEYCKKVCVDNGIRVPICIYGHGWDHLDALEPEEHNAKLSGKRFRFLHVSSGFPRKGIDILISAFETGFAQDSSTELVLKTFPNEHNNVAEILSRLRDYNPDVADRIIWINRDLPAGSIKKLYADCHAFVSPTRGEGFGLPMLEAMALGLPIIATSNGGHADFCTERTSWLVSCAPSPSKSHLRTFNSYWQEPDLKDLVAKMQTVRNASTEELKKKLKNAKLVSSKFTWAASALAAAEFVRYINNEKPFDAPPCKVAFVTTWNARCGIAKYSEYLVEHLRRRQNIDLIVLSDSGSTPLQPDESWVSRPWWQSFKDDPSSTRALEKAIAKNRCASIVIQFNFGFFNVRYFGELLDRLHDAGRVVIVCFHSTHDVDKPDLRASLSEIIPALSRCHRLLVHSMVDLRRFYNWGLSKNVALFPHGIEPRTPHSKQELRRRFGLSGGPIIATFGFCLPQKGLVETIEAFALLKREYSAARLLMLNALYSEEASRDTADACRMTVEKHALSESVTINNEFLPESVCLDYLDACDIVVFAYGMTGESSSAAVRTALRSSAKVLCSRVSIFDDVKEVVSFSENASPGEILCSIRSILSDPAKHGLIENARINFLRESRWEACATRLEAMIQRS